MPGYIDQLPDIDSEEQKLINNKVSGENPTNSSHFSTQRTKKKVYDKFNMLGSDNMVHWTNA